MIDYVLTIAISIASGADAIFSFLPTNWLWLKFWLCLVVVVLMVGMNLRGVKESVLSLLPIFLAFVVMHAWLVGYALLVRSPELPAITRDAIDQVHTGVSTVGVLALAIIFFRAYSMGAGTYTGIEAVSNGLPILREPRTATGKRTMVYMAVSLAVTGRRHPGRLPAVQRRPGARARRSTRCCSSGWPTTGSCWACRSECRSSPSP